MDHDGARWIEELPAGLAAQQGLLRGLRAFSQDDPDVAWLVVGCSLARDAGQLDLVVYPPTVFAGSIPHVVVLYDQDSVLAAPDTVPPVHVTPSQVREWAFQGWCALADLGKYARRGSAWEALERLHEARAQLWPLACGWRSCPGRSVSSWTGSSGRRCRRPWDVLSPAICWPRWQAREHDFASGGHQATVAFAAGRAGRAPDRAVR
jgi:hypothetical protein